MKITYTVYGATAAEIEASAAQPAKDFFSNCGPRDFTVHIRNVTPFLVRGDGTVDTWEATVEASAARWRGDAH